MNKQTKQIPIEHGYDGYVTAAMLNSLVQLTHGRSVNAGWYHNPKTDRRKPRNVGEMLALIHSEISEALEGYRKGLMDGHLPHRKMIEVELADAVIRIGDLAGYLKLDLGGAVVEKMEYNLYRKDHKIKARQEENGKRF